MNLEQPLGKITYVQFTGLLVPHLNRGEAVLTGVGPPPPDVRELVHHHVTCDDDHLRVWNILLTTSQIGKGPIYLSAKQDFEGSTYQIQMRVFLFTASVATLVIFGKSDQTDVCEKVKVEGLLLYPTFNGEYTRNDSWVSTCLPQTLWAKNCGDVVIYYQSDPIFNLTVWIIRDALCPENMTQEYVVRGITKGGDGLLDVKAWEEYDGSLWVSNSGTQIKCLVTDTDFPGYPLLFYCLGFTVVVLICYIVARKCRSSYERRRQSPAVRRVPYSIYSFSGWFDALPSYEECLTLPRPNSISDVSRGSIITFEAETSDGACVTPPPYQLALSMPVLAESPPLPRRTSSQATISPASEEVPAAEEVRAAEEVLASEEVVEKEERCLPSGPNDVCE